MLFVIKSKIISFLRTKTLLSNSFFLLITGIVTYVLYLVLSYSYQYTYIWQSTILADSLFPITRTHCNFPLNYAIDFSVNKETISSNDENNKERKRNIRFGVLILYKDGDGSWGDELISKVVRNRERYCKKHGYTLLNGNSLIDSSRPVAWSKLLAMKHFLMTNNFDYVIYVDMDVVIMNMDIRLDLFLQGTSERADLIMTNDWSGLNTGVWIARNSFWTSTFLQMAFEQTQLIQKFSKDGKPHPFEFEQRAFHYLTNSPVWQSRGLPVFPGNTTEIVSHIETLPQCAFNSYSLHPLYWKGDREVSQYIDGDFLIHFAGKKGQNKKDLMLYYLGLAETRSLQ